MEVINVTSSILRFNPVQFGDEGMYMCEVTSDDLNITSDDVTITSKMGYNEFVLSPTYA